MIISTTLMKPESRLVFHKGRVIVFDDVDIEQEVRDVVKKVLRETKCILEVTE